MSKINDNELAVILTKLEGKKINLSIAQVKEVLKLVKMRVGPRFSTPVATLSWLGWK